MQFWQKCLLPFNYRLYWPSVFDNKDYLKFLQFKEQQELYGKNTPNHDEASLNKKYNEFHDQLNHLNICIIDKVREDLKKSENYPGEFDSVFKE